MRFPEVPIRPLQQGEVFGPVDQIKFRLKSLVLPDVVAFDKSLVQSTDGSWQTLGPPSSFWSSLVSWIDKQGIRTPEALAIKTEVERFSSQPDPADSQAVVKTSLTVQAAKQAHESKHSPPQIPSKEPNSSTPWSIIVGFLVAATGLLWLLVKKGK